MNRLASTLAILLLLSLGGCANDATVLLPPLTITGGQQLAPTCSSIYPGGRWQFTHSITFARNGGAAATVLGVTSLDNGNLACAMMTPEGFTLFAAVAGPDGKIDIRRAVPPFDKPAFAEGLIRDVRLIFLPPPEDAMIYGRLADGTPVCRATRRDGRTTDIIPAADGCWRIESYGPDAARERSLVTRSCRRIDNVPMPEYLELTGYGSMGYTLKMTLVNAENLNTKTPS